MFLESSDPPQDNEGGCNPLSSAGKRDGQPPKESRNELFRSATLQGAEKAHVLYQGTTFSRAVKD
jgi:hypothetical protein